MPPVVTLRTRSHPPTSVDFTHRASFAYVTATLPDGEQLWLCRLRYGWLGGPLTPAAATWCHSFACCAGVFEITKHRQPSDTERVLTKIAEIPPRSASSEVGFDGIGITVLDLHNDSSPVRLVTGPPAPQPGDSFNYDSMIVRMANKCDTTFAYI